MNVIDNSVYRNDSKSISVPQEQDFKDLMDEVKKSNEENAKIRDEIRKLKAVIVKHENRIRALEAEQAVSKDVIDTSATSAADSNNNNNNNETTTEQSKVFAPDEV